MDGVVASIDRCAWAETDRMFAAFQAQAGVVSAWSHYRTPIAEQDGSITVDFSGCGVGQPTRLPITDGRSYTVRLYRLRAEIPRPAPRRGGQGGGVHGWKEPRRSPRQHRRSSDIR
jgi:hypothetical protein